MPLPVNYIYSNVAYEILPPAIPELPLSSGGLPSTKKKKKKKGTPPSKAPASSTTKVPENVNFNIGDRVHHPKFEVGTLRITVVNEVGGSSESRVCDLTVAPMNPNITLEENIIRSDDPDLKFVCKASSKDASIGTRNVHTPSNEEQQANLNTMRLKVHDMPTLPQPRATKRATRHNTETTDAVAIGQALTNVAHSFWPAETPRPFHLGMSEDFSGSNPWPEGEGSWFNYHTSGGAYAQPAKPEATVTTMNSKTKVVAWNNGIFRQTGEKPVSVYDENYDPLFDSRAYFVPTVESCIKNRPRVCFLFKAIRRGCMNAPGVKISVNSIVRLTDGTFFYIFFIWKDSNTDSPICNGDYMMSGDWMKQEEVGGPLQHSWMNFSTASSKFSSSSKGNVDALITMTGTADQSKFLAKLQSACRPLVEKFLRRPTVTIHNSLKLSNTGKPIAFYEPKVPVEVTDTEIEVVGKSKLLDLVPTKRNSCDNFRRLLTGVQKQIVGKVASQLQSQNNGLELILEKSLNQCPSLMQPTPTKTQRDEEINQLKQMEMVESLRVARDSQRLAEVSRIEAEKRCDSLHETAFAALQARAHAAERNTEFMQFAMNQSQVMCMAQGYVQQRSKDISAPDMTNFLEGMRYASPLAPANVSGVDDSSVPALGNNTQLTLAPGHVSGVDDSSVPAPGYNTQLTLTNGVRDEHENVHTSPKTAKLIRAKKIRAEFAALKRRIEFFPNEEKKKQKIAELDSMEAEATALENEGMA